MTDWFARPVLHVKDVETSIRFYVDRLGFACPWRNDEDGVAQVDRDGCSLILADTWPEKIGKGLIFISLNFETEVRLPQSMCCARNSRPRVLWSRVVGGATASWSSMIRTGINSSSIIRTRPHLTRLLEVKRNII